jgi:superfamily II DNA or RNA helicase
VSIQNASLSAKLTYSVDRNHRSRGESCFEQGNVSIQHGSSRSVIAQVQDAKAYDVRLDLEGDTLLVECRCPLFKHDRICRHVWATILAAESQKYMGDASSIPYLYMEEGTLGFKETVTANEGKRRASAPGADPKRTASSKPAPPPAPPAWLDRISKIPVGSKPEAMERGVLYAGRQILYFIDARSLAQHSGYVVAPEMRERKTDGEWGKAKQLYLKVSDIPYLPAADDREICSMLAGSKQHYGWGYGDSDTVPTFCQVRHPLSNMLMPILARTGRCYLRYELTGDDQLGNPLTWSGGDPWRFVLRMSRTEAGEWEVKGELCRNGERMELSAPSLITEGGLVFANDTVAPLAADTPFACLTHFRQTGSMRAAESDRDQMLNALLSVPGLPDVEVPEELRYEEVNCAPTPYLHVHSGDERYAGRGRLRARLSFEYEGKRAALGDGGKGLYDGENRRLIRRDLEKEKASAAVLDELGIKRAAPSYPEYRPEWEIASGKLPTLVRSLLAYGWRVEAEGRLFRSPGVFRLGVSSGVDWFELHGEVQYGDISAKLPELLQAARRGETMVKLGNGEYGMLPEDWLRRFGYVVDLGTAVDGHVRFQANQAGLLDALLAAQPEVNCDETFARVRREIASFRGVQAADQPAGFVGQLREYQREGLGWMHFLRRLSFGGCLADDMGVGKTAQVLALLESRREQRAADASVPPSLVVVPKSLVFNWKAEAARFAPNLRVLDYTGLARKGESFENCDVALTTYGTLRRDILALKELDFDYVVLDEAQAVKNANTDSAKAVRLVKSRHRLALSGTPIENHVGELWALFDFLNPGMLGAGAIFKDSGTAARSVSEDSRRLMASALRPFILRRTKEQVAKELPSKTEQTIHCEMEPLQRKLYNELSQHYRNSLLERIEAEGLAKSKIQVLEALLRLRQAACHPGLIDAKRKGETSAKLEVLLARVTEVVQEGHKALVFSQFTSLLGIVRNRLDEAEIPYEYLDGRTRDRQERVDHFQNDPNCRLFLISLKAGGLGLNLTAAEYVFLLDPWWNPAVEAQAVDRAHRIGQTRQVFAYRLITKDTVEEKVLELQQSKRDLAAAIIGEDNSLIRNLQREDLELLLS